MKKAIATFFSFILGIFGLTVVDKTIDARMAKLEADVSGLSVAVSSLEALHQATTAPVTTTTTNAGGFIDVRTCPYFEFLWRAGDGYVRVTITEHVYKLNHVIPQSDDPQTPEEASDRYVYDVRIKGQAPTECAGEKLMFGGKEVFIGADGSFEIEVQSTSVSLTLDLIVEPPTTVPFTTTAP